MQTLSPSAQKIQDLLNSLGYNYTVIEHTESTRTALEAATQREAQLRAECARVEGEWKAVEAALAQTRAELAAETERRSAAESQTGELSRVRTELEAEVARRQEAEAQVRQELDAKRTELELSREKLSVDQGQLEARAQELPFLFKYFVTNA